MTTNAPASIFKTISQPEIPIATIKRLLEVVDTAAPDQRRRIVVAQLDGQTFTLAIDYGASLAMIVRGEARSIHQFARLVDALD